MLELQRRARAVVAWLAAHRRMVALGALVLLAVVLLWLGVDAVAGALGAALVAALALVQRYRAEPPSTVERVNAHREAAEARAAELERAGAQGARAAEQPGPGAVTPEDVIGRWGGPPRGLVLAALAAAVAAAGPVRAACPEWAGRGVSEATCAAVDACVARAAAAGDPEIRAANPTVRALLEVNTRLARCAWAAQTASTANARATAALRPVPVCPTPAPCAPCATVERPVWVDAASHTGACVLCGAVAAGAATAACTGGP